MDEPVDYTLTEKAKVLTLAARVGELERLVDELNRATVDLRVYCLTVDGMPDEEQWATVLELLEEVRDAYGLGRAIR